MKREDIEELREILSTMNVPSKRVNPIQFHWLGRNLITRNRKHPRFNRAMEILYESVTGMKVQKDSIYWWMPNYCK